MWSGNNRSVILSTALLVVAFGVASCGTRLSVEKRHYRPGYHVEFAEAKHKVEHRKVQREDPERVPLHNGTAPVDELAIAPAIMGTVSGADELGQLTAPAPQAEGTYKEGNRTNTSEEGWASLVAERRIPYGKQRIGMERTAFLDQVRSMPAPPATPEDAQFNSQNKALRIAGIVLLSVGFILFLFVTWLIGLFIMLGGLAMVLSARPRPGQRANRYPTEEAKPEWQDVVYLKNGSIIRGMIIEQVPNESLKVMTIDGSVFHYAMEDVVKITKEQKLSR